MAVVRDQSTGLFNICDVNFQPVLDGSGFPVRLGLLMLERALELEAEMRYADARQVVIIAILMCVAHPCL